VARITMPKARVRLSAGRQQLGEVVQALCFLAGANSIFYGDKLLVTGNPDANADLQLLQKLGLRNRQTQEEGAAPAANAAQGCGCGCTCG
jgi:biotin synthase